MYAGESLYFFSVYCFNTRIVHGFVTSSCFIFPNISPFLGNTANQVGFEARHGTDRYVFVEANYYILRSP